ncbi:MAG: hypothetical protein ACRDUY_09825 [Nitriliruptorales bacterium]
MTRQRPVSPSAMAQIVVALVVAALLIGFLGWLNRTAPLRELEPIGQGVEEPHGEELSLLTCRRVLPDRPPEGIETQAAPLGFVRSNEVVSCPDLFDPASAGGPPVQYVGEVVGDVLVRDGGAWVLVNDDGYALEDGPVAASGRFHGTNTGIAAWLPDEVIDVSSLVPGRPRLRGDILRIQGRIHRVDPADGGGLTLRATAVDVLVEATPAEPVLHRGQLAAALVFAVIALALTLYERYRRATR